MRTRSLWLAMAAMVALVPTLAVAQRTCGTMENHAMLLEQDKDLPARLAQIEAQTQQFVNDPYHPELVVTIPTVFHIVYNTSAQNIPDAQVLSQLQVLNEDFRRLNADASQTRAAFLGVAADAEIQFCLASRDPTGAPTTGITRTQTATTSFNTNNNVKHAATGGHDAWPAGQYLNIWIAPLGGGLLGYAQFPGGAAATDGVVVTWQSVGRGYPTNLSAYNSGRSATHEVGHWLNLIHLWGDSSTCGVDDLVADTPDSNASTFGCPYPSTLTQCGNSVQYENYMDYTDDPCMNMFTLGQKSRMQALFGPGGFRASLLTSTGCAPSVPQYQVNSPRSNLDADGVQGTSSSPAVTTKCIGTSGTVHLSSVPAAIGFPFDMALNLGSLVPRNAGTYVTPGGQILNVPLPGMVFISTGAGASIPLPWSGNLSLPFTATVPLTASLQMFVGDPSNADGIAFSQGVQITTVAGGAFAAGPVGDDVSAAISLGGATCSSNVTFFGVSYSVLNVGSNGRITFGGSSTDFSPTVAEATSGLPFVGFWTDLNVTGAATVSVSAPAANKVRVAYNAVPYFGTTVANTFAIEFDTSANTVRLDGLLGIPANTAAAGTGTRQFLGISRGTGATDSGVTTFSAGGSGTPATTTRMWYDFYNNTGGGQCASLAGSLNSILFTPLPAGNYSWAGF